MVSLFINHKFALTSRLSECTFTHPLQVDELKEDRIYGPKKLSLQGLETKKI